MRPLVYPSESAMFDTLTRPHVTAARVLPYSHLESELRTATLWGCPDVRPYQNCEIRVTDVKLDDLWPLALYVLRDKLQFAVDLRQSLLAHGVDPWGLPSIVEFDQDGGHHRIAPPVIEVSPETDCGCPRPLLAIVDGLHRCFAARARGLETITVVLIAGAAYPLICRPVAWSEVAVLDTVPEMVRKRVFRFREAGEIARKFPEFAAKVTEENSHYFFFRNLQRLGSSGAR